MQANMMKDAATQANAIIIPPHEKVQVSILLHAGSLQWV